MQSKGLLQKMSLPLPQTHAIRGGGRRMDWVKDSGMWELPFGGGSLCKYHLSWTHIHHAAIIRLSFNDSCFTMSPFTFYYVLLS